MKRHRKERAWEKDCNERIGCCHSKINNDTSHRTFNVYHKIEYQIMLLFIFCEIVVIICIVIINVMQ